MTSRANPDRLRPMLSVPLEGTAAPVEPAAMRGILQRLSSQLGELERRGIRVIFVEMPMRPELISTPYYQSGLDAAKARFPTTRYEWMRFADRAYETSNGTHLGYKDARTVAERISDTAQGYLQ